MLNKYRASYFSYISSTSYVVSFIGPTLASFTMSRIIWLPFWIHITLLLCALPTIRLLPETKIPASSSGSATDGDVDEVDPLLAGLSQRPGSYSNAFETKFGVLQSIPNAIRKLLRLVVGRQNFQILLISFFLTALASSDTKLLVQYISKRYEWTFAQVSNL